MNKICIVYTHHKLGDLIWQLPYIKAISQHHQTNIDLVVREKTQAQNILKDLKHINQIFYNDFRKGLLYWVDVFKLIKVFKSEKYDFVYILDKVNKPAIAAKIAKIKNIIGPGFKNQKKWLTVKNFLNECQGKSKLVFSKFLPPKENLRKSFEIITKKPILPSDDEIKINRKARSAKLRIAKRTKFSPVFKHEAAA